MSSSQRIRYASLLARLELRVLGLVRESSQAQGNETHTPCEGANAEEEDAKARAATAAAKKVVERSMVALPVVADEQ